MKQTRTSIAFVVAVGSAVLGIFLGRAIGATGTPLEIEFLDACDGMSLLLNGGKVTGTHTAADCDSLAIKVKGTSDGTTITLTEKMKGKDESGPFFDIDGDGKNDKWRWRIHDDHTYQIDYYSKPDKEYFEFWTGPWGGGDFKNSSDRPQTLRTRR